MSQKKALKIVSILFVCSLIVIIVHAVLLHVFPEKFDKETAIDNEQEAEDIVLDELPINEVLASATTKNTQNVFSWTYDSSVPIYHQVDLSIYNSKVKDENALNGITVYLSQNKVTTSSASKENVESLDENDENSGIISESDENIINLNQEYTDDDYQKILNNILLQTKNNLESIGATVIILDQAIDDDLQKAAFVGKDILEDFIEELSEQKFKSDTLDLLIEPLKSIQSSPENQTFFADVGVSSEHRLLLDVERQYSDRLYINIRFGESENIESGSLVRYFGNQSASIGAQGDTLSAESSEKPAYIAYDTENRQRLANLANKNINQLLPGLNSDLEEGIKEDIIPCLRLINLNSMDITIGQKGEIYDMQILTSEEQQKILAEAISNACFEYYCTELE